MYSSVFRAHQRIDRAAFRQLNKFAHDTGSLRLDTILHFEGKRGPDATKLKKGDSTPPWHFYDPGGENPRFFTTVQKHYDNLVQSLKEGNAERAGFEASWLAHALVDGLTPAHHFPYREALEDLYGMGIEERGTVGSHFFVKGETHKETIKKSFKLVGPKGLLTTHTSFEAGAALIILPLTLTNTRLTLEELAEVNGATLVDIFERYAHEIEKFKMYERFHKWGWTAFLARDIRLKLAPRMVRIVTLAWYGALKDAGIIKK
jgi:hypothetical protein